MESAIKTIPKTMPALLLAVAALSGTLAVASASAVELILAVVASLVVLYLFRDVRHSSAVFFGAFAIMSLWAFVISPRHVSDFAPAKYRAVAEECRLSSASQHILATVVKRNDEECKSFKIALTVTDISPAVHTGDIIDFAGELQPLGRRAAIPYMRMSEQTSRSKGVSAVCVVHSGKISVVGHSSKLKYRFCSIRDRLAEKIYASNLSPESASLLVASALGTGDADVVVKEKFRLSGLSHLLCVSGFHTAVFALVFSVLLFPLRLLRNGRRRHLILLVVVWLYALVTGFSPSVIRASIMISAYYAAKIMQREPKPSNTLCLAFFLVLLVNPYYLFSAGFQLSFSAVAGLLLFGQKLNPVPMKKRWAHRLVALFTTPLSAILGTLPVLLVWFHRIPLFSIPANAFASLIFPVFMIGGIIAVMLGNTTLGLFLCKIIDALYRFMNSLLDGFVELSENYEFTLSPSLVTLIAIVLAIMVIAYILHVQGVRKRLVASAVLVLLIIVGCLGMVNRDSNTYLIIDGDSRGSDVHIARFGEAISIPAKGKREPVSDYSHLFEAFGADVKIDAARGLIPTATGLVAILDSDTKIEDISNAEFLVVTHYFRDDLSQYIDGENVMVVVVGADVDYRRRRAYRLICSKAGVEVCDISTRAFCRVMQNE
ncbi:MAG: ComEC/Rec2 family competence protein [Muribaculaceae bacterium]|nr:ComEC/Rec2 family competence protein [Muribaculaceae bacterium]